MLRFNITGALASAALAAVIFLALRLMLPTKWLHAVALGVLFGATLAAAYRYAPAALRALRKGHSGAEILVVAMFTVSVGLLIETSWHMARASPVIPTRMVYAAAPTLIAWVMAWAMLLAVAAPDTRVTPWRSIAVFGGGSVLGVLLAAHPLL